MRNQPKIFAASGLQSHLIIMKKFVTYLKKTAHFYTQLQSYKKQLATYINCIDYTLPFSALDMDKRGLVTQKNLQNFLIQHKHFHKPVDINIYYKKYTHGKNQLEYDDVVECLVPHSDYVLMSGTVKNITESFISKQNSLYFCNRVQNQIIKTIVALIISTEISYLSSAFKMLDNITNNSLKSGTMLWRIIDRNHDNMLDYQRMRKIGQQNGQNIGQIQWKNFINWHFRKHKKYLNRSDFMIIFDCLVVDKRNGSDCNIENFVQAKILRTYSSLQRLNASRVMEKTASKVMEKTRDSFNFNQSSQSLSHLQTAKNLVFQVAANPKLYEDKSLLYTKLGYKNPNNLIKKSYLLQ